MHLIILYSWFDKKTLYYMYIYIYYLNFQFINSMYIEIKQEWKTALSADDLVWWIANTLSRKIRGKILKVFLSLFPDKKFLSLTDFLQENIFYWTNFLFGKGQVIFFFFFLHLGSFFEELKAWYILFKK